MGVACLNAQLFTREQEDDLEHTGHPFFPHCQRHHAYLTFPRNGMQRPPLALLWAWWSGYRLSLHCGLNDLPTSTLWLAWVLTVTGKGTRLVPSPAFAPSLRLLWPQTARSWRRYRSSVLWGNSHRFPVSWKALKIWQRVGIEPYVLSGWLPAGDGEVPWCYITRSTRALVHQRYYTTWPTLTMMHIISICAWGFLDSSAADRFHCSRAITKFTGPTLH